MNKMDCKLLGVCLRLHSEQKELADFIRDYAGLQTNFSGERDPDICVNFKVNDHFQVGKNYRRISRNIWLSKSSVFISEIERFPGLKLEAKIEEGRFYVNAFLVDKNQSVLRKMISHLISKENYKDYKFIGLLYYIIFIPFFYYLERFRNLFLLHASAIKYHEKGVILSGLGGIGKSTFSLGTLLLKGCTFISDNLIFYDYQNIYSCPEPIALDTRSIDILKDVTNLLIPKRFEFTHGRMLYKIKQEAISSEAIPKYLFWLQCGNENKILPLDKDTCIRHLSNINLLAKEVREYYILAAAFDLVLPKSLSRNSYGKTLTSLLSSVDCFVLQFKPGDDLETVFNKTLNRVLL